jgi:O-6-methylguanine DNA methyltransferase
MHETLYYCLEETPFGCLALLGSARGLLRVSLQPEPAQALDGLGEVLDGATENTVVFADELAAFSTYFAGNVTALDQIPLDLSHASPFFGAAWAACRGIPPGETRSYQWLAEAAGNPRASRAAGQAMAKNPFPLIVPCHRVVGSKGDLHGYGAGGVGVKARLLEMERNRGALL